MRRLEFSDGKSHKFWAIACVGNVVTTQWGRIGTAGQEASKVFASAAAATAAMEKQIRAKVDKGYLEVGATPAGPTGMAPTVAPVAVAPVASAPLVEAPANEPSSGDLADGESTQAAGSGGRFYTLSNSGGVYSCTCPAWRNQSVGIERRTCKHLRRFRGDAAETARLGALPARALPRSEAKEGAPALLLANRWEPGVHDPTGWWMSEKLDGVRAYWDGQRFLSRLGNAYTAPAWFTADLPDHPLDGELFAGRKRFQATVSIARRQDRSEHWKQLTYVIFDAPAVPGGFEERLASLQEQRWTYARVLEQERCTGTEAVLAELQRVEALGAEGLMLRQPGSAYVGGRSDTLLKVKSFFDCEAKVTGHAAGAGKHRGRLGALEVVLADGTAFKVGTGFTDAQREAPPAIGAIVTVRYQELTDAGVPRFPTFVGERDDAEWPG